VGASIALGLFRKMGYNKIMVSSILISRWNSKRIADDYDLKRGITRRSISQLDIQRNLTDKFIRTFRRLDFQHSGINVLNGVSEDSSYLMLYLDENDECCNDLLRETYSLGSDFVRKISK
jgi:hypothetical protein